MRARLFGLCVLAVVATACTGSSTSMSTTAPSADKCAVSVEADGGRTAPAAGMSSALTITTTRDCTWAAATDAGWVSILPPTSGQGSGSLSYRVNPNAEPAPRQATLEINNIKVALTQNAAPCTYTVAPTNADVSANGGNVLLTVETLTGCAWSAATAVPWIGVPAATPNSRSGTVTLTIARNGNPVPRTGTVTVAQQTITIQQAAASPEPEPAPTPAPPSSPAPPPPAPVPAPPPTPTPAPCAYTITPAGDSVGADASTGSIQVTAGAGCTWNATGGSSWVTITTGGTGAGNGSVGYAIAANPGAARSATLTVAGKTFTISQAAAPPPVCTFSISPTTQTVADTGAPGSIAVTASAGACAWTATSSAPWIGITAGQSGTGSGTVSFAVAANTGATARSGTIVAGGKTFTVTQSAPPPPCTFTLAPTSQSVADTAGSGTIAVTASTTTCAWTAAANVGWLSVTSGASGTGNGSVAFAIAANTGAIRSGTLTVGGQTFTVSQAAAPPACTFTIAPTTLDMAKAGGPGSVTVTASAPSCTWGAAANVSWLTLTSPASGTGNGAVSFTADANAGSDRTGTITVAGQTFTVTQHGQ